MNTEEFRDEVAIRIYTSEHGKSIDPLECFVAAERLLEARAKHAKMRRQHTCDHDWEYDAASYDINKSFLAHNNLMPPSHAFLSKSEALTALTVQRYGPTHRQFFRTCKKCLKNDCCEVPVVMNQITGSITAPGGGNVLPMWE